MLPVQIMYTIKSVLKVYISLDYVFKNFFAVLVKFSVCSCVINSRQTCYYEEISQYSTVPALKSLSPSSFRKFKFTNRVVFLCCWYFTAYSHFGVEIF
jgi:hypothetical protein